MRRRWFQAALHPALLSALAACASTPEAPPAEAEASAAEATTEAPAETETPPPATTRYRRGNNVSYRYSGAFSKQPVVLYEEVIMQEGLELQILVEARRGEDKRTWLQVVTDTPENQKSEVIDKLFEIEGVSRFADGRVIPMNQKLLANENNRDIYRLYEWTLPPELHPTGVPGRVEEELTILGRSYRCVREIGTGKVEGQSVRFSFANCPDFLWTNGPASIVTEAGVEIWKREVLATGTEAPLPSSPEPPTR